MAVWPLGDWIPQIAADAFIAPSAEIMGRVVIEARASVWYGCVLRGDIEPILVGEGANVQDTSVLHTERDLPCVIGRGVTVGHSACVHGATIGEYSLIGIGANVLSGATVGAGSIVAAGALVGEGKTVPPGALVAGIPFKVIREITDAEKENLRHHADRYVEYARQHRQWLEQLKKS